MLRCSTTIALGRGLKPAYLNGMASTKRSEAEPGRRQVVQSAADALREMIFSRPAGEQIGSLPDIARALGVGIVSIQQAARILEHEGLLEVRRGPGGGYYGRRPDIDALERSLAAYMRARPASWAEALDMTSLLFNELVAAAAGCAGEQARKDLAAFSARLDGEDGAHGPALEMEMQDLLFRMVNRPLFELLTRVTLRFSASLQPEPGTQPAFPPAPWRESRPRIIAAILAGDRELARFEADRGNRRIVLGMIAGATSR